MVCVSRVAYKQANETSYDLFPQRKYLQSGTRRGAHVKGAGSGIDLERDGGGGEGAGARRAGARRRPRTTEAALRKGAARLTPCLPALTDAD